MGGNAGHTASIWREKSRGKRQVETVYKGLYSILGFIQYTRV